MPGLALAGDGVRIDLPVALMERAATTGWSAANHFWRTGDSRATPLSTRPHPGPLGHCCAVWPAEKGTAT